MIEFKTYENEKQLEEQIALIAEITKDWVGWAYPNKDQLKAAYDREGFTPETRHYVYDGDKLVAFLASAVERIVEGVQQGSIQAPFVLAGYEHLEEKLMKKAIDDLKSRGVKVIVSRQRPAWGNLKEIFKKKTNQTPTNYRKKNRK